MIVVEGSVNFGSGENRSNFQWRLVVQKYFECFCFVNVLSVLLPHENSFYINCLNISNLFNNFILNEIHCGDFMYSFILVKILALGAPSAFF